MIRVVAQKLTARKTTYRKRTKTLTVLLALAQLVIAVRTHSRQNVAYLLCCRGSAHHHAAPSRHLGVQVNSDHGVGQRLDLHSDSTLHRGNVAKFSPRPLVVRSPVLKTEGDET